MTQLPQRLHFNLTNPLARQTKVLAYFLERIVPFLFNSVAHPQNPPLSHRQQLEHGPRLVNQRRINQRIGRGRNALIFEHVTQT